MMASESSASSAGGAATWFGAWLIPAVACLLFLVSAAADMTTALQGYAPFMDDAYYYIIVARNFVDSGRFSFDGVNTTNGFHPLWEFLLVGIYAVIGSKSSLLLQVLSVRLLEKLCLAATIALIVRALYRHAHDSRELRAGLLTMVLFLCLPTVISPFRIGMECSLVALLVSGALIALWEGRIRALGIWLALLFLARLDSLVFAVAPIALWGMVYLCANWRERLWLVAPVATAFAIYAGINFVLMGHIVPISGALKSSFPWPRPQPGFYVEDLAIAGKYGWRVLIDYVTLTGISAVAILAGALLLGFRRGLGRPKLLLVAGLSLILVLNIILFQKWDKSLPPNYYALPGLLAAFAFGGSLQLLIERVSWLRTYALGGVFIVLALMLGKGYADHWGSDTAHSLAEGPIWEITRYVKQHSTPETTFAATDPGALAFWSERRWVDLDGLVNSFEYQDFLKRGQLGEFLQRNHVEYLFVVLWTNEQWINGRPAEKMYAPGIQPQATRGTDYAPFDYRIYSYLYERYSEPLRLTPEQEWYRIFLGPIGVADGACVIYRLSGTADAGAAK